MTQSVKTQSKKRPQPPGRPKDMGKRDAILDAAKQLFASHGFDGTSMDTIARVAEVSKLTVYSHFGDKEALFKAAVESKCEQQMPADLFQVPPGTPIRTALLAIAQGFHGLIHSPESLSLHRMMIANAGQDVHLAELFFDAGPRKTLSDFERFLNQAIAARQLDIPEPSRAAQHFFCLLKGIGHLKLLCGCAKPVPKKEVAAHIDSVVDMFLRAYGRR
ncbi:MAG: TetR/AcrR family transcriptional regulator [Rhodanobacteraceae bacterium]|nr:TetR/AcrR family transcriptional regulator [Rhodanobacteraceae bacterium]